MLGCETYVAATALELCRGSFSLHFLDRVDVVDPSNTAPAHSFDTKEGKRYDDDSSEEWRDRAEADH